MSSENKDQENQPSEEAAKPAEAETGPSESDLDAIEEALRAGGSDDVVAALEQLTILEAENADLKDKLMRALAEVENVRRRSEKERQDTAKFGASGLAKELLPAIDNLGRALQSVPEEMRDGDDSVKNLVLGVEMIEKQFVDALSRFKITRIEPTGEKYSYELHQAMSEVEGTGHPAGTVVQVLQPGYVMHERLLRPAMVIVAKGDPTKDRPEGHEPVDTTA